MRDQGRQRVALAVRSDMDLDAQVRAPGATWLDRCNLASDGRDLGGGFGTEVRAAMEARGWQPVKPRDRRVSPALEAYAAMTTSAARGAIRDVSQVKQR